LFTGWLHGDAATPNQLRFMFLEPGARELVVGWPERAQRLVAEFRADIGRHADQAPLAGLIAELAGASAPFRQWWRRGRCRARRGIAPLPASAARLAGISSGDLHLARSSTT
jgi:hypothetical protein